MAQSLFLLVSMVIVCLAPGIHGSSHLMFSNNVEPNITRTGCGFSKLCVDEPLGCDPTSDRSCLFSSILSGPAVAPNGSLLNFTLRGIANVDEYIGVGLTVNASVGTTMLFVCANVNNSVRFFTRNASNTDGSLTATERPVRNIASNISGNVVRCQFTVPNVNASTSTRGSSTTFIVKIGNGTLNGTTVTLGNFVVQRQTGLLDVSDPTSLNRPMGSNAAFTSPASLLVWSVLACLALLRM